MPGRGDGEAPRDEDTTDRDTTETRHDPGSGREDAEVRRVFSGTGLYVGFVVLAVLAIALAIFAAQNTETVEVAFTAFEFRTPLIVVVLVTVVATAIATEVAGAVWRHNRRRVRNEREELARLRRSTRGSGTGET